MRRMAKTDKENEKIVVSSPWFLFLVFWLTSWSFLCLNYVPGT